jgi:hypothetical protein
MMTTTAVAVTGQGWLSQAMATVSGMKAIARPPTAAQSRIEPAAASHPKSPP